VVRCCRPAAWRRSFQSSGKLLPIGRGQARVLLR
jgi:hypothetical protein